MVDVWLEGGGGWFSLWRGWIWGPRFAIRHRQDGNSRPEPVYSSGVATRVPTSDFLVNFDLHLLDHRPSSLHAHVRGC